MDEKKTVQEEIEESLRICEEVLNDNPDIISKKPDINLEEILGGTEPASLYKNPVSQGIGEPVGTENKAAVMPEKQSAVQTETAQTGSQKRSVVRTLVSILVCIVIAVAAAVLITYFVANHTTVEGSSMEPCLANGDELIVEKISYLTGEPERFDVIVFKFDENTKYIKRIIGLPGEKVRIEEGKIYINEKAIFDEHANGVMEEAGIAEKTVTLGNGEYFVLGDNRNASKDSRHKDVGVVKADQIIGKAWLRMMPFDNFGFIK